MMREAGIGRLIFFDACTGTLIKRHSNMPPRKTRAKAPAKAKASPKASKKKGAKAKVEEEDEDEEEADEEVGLVCVCVCVCAVCTQVSNCINSGDSPTHWRFQCACGQHATCCMDEPCSVLMSSACVALLCEVSSSRLGQCLPSSSSCSKHL
jgi:hypothetical protein